MNEIESPRSQTPAESVALIEAQIKLGEVKVRQLEIQAEVAKSRGYHATWIVFWLMLGLPSILVALAKMGVFN